MTEPPTASLVKKYTETRGLGRSEEQPLAELLSAKVVRKAQGVVADDRVEGVIGGSLRLELPAQVQELEAAAAFLTAQPKPADTPQLALEIGFGDGSFLCSVAAAHPTVRFLGLEVRRKTILATRARIARHHLTNVHVLEGDARVVLRRLLRPASLAQVWILFPDPWWKLRHWTRRTLVTPPFADLLHGLLAPAGVVTCKTDVPAVAEQLRLVFDAHPGFAPWSADRIVPPVDATTKRERRCISEATPFQVGRWIRQEQA